MQEKLMHRNLDDSKTVVIIESTGETIKLC